MGLSVRKVRKDLSADSLFRLVRARLGGTDKLPGSLVFCVPLALLISRLQRLLATLSESAGFYLRIQLPVTLSEFNASEPDIAVVRGTGEDYADRHPGPADLVLVIEVSDSLVGTDRATKQRLYATAGVTRYWLVNVAESQVEDYEQPDSTSGKYAQQTIFQPSQTLAWNVSPTQRLEINLTDLFH